MPLRQWEAARLICSQGGVRRRCEHRVDAFDEKPGVTGDKQKLSDEKDEGHGFMREESVVEGLREELPEDGGPDAVRGDRDDVEEDEAEEPKPQTCAFRDEKAERKQREDEIGRP